MGWSFLQKSIQNNDFFSYSENLALTLSTDGVPLFKSSSVSLWPVYLPILNLPPEVRMNSKNIIFGRALDWYNKACNETVVGSCFGQPEKAKY